MDGTAVGLDQGSIAVNHAVDLFALVRMDQKHDFILPHEVSSRIEASRQNGEARRLNK
jgi:hypothetical protein